MGHGGGVNANHISGLAGNNGRAKNVIRSFFDMHPSKAFSRSIQHGAVDCFQRLCIGVHSNAVDGRLMSGESHVSDLWLGIHAPWNG